MRHSRSMKSGDDADIGTPPCILKVLEKLKMNFALVCILKSYLQYIYITYYFTLSQTRHTTRAPQKVSPNY